MHISFEHYRIFYEVAATGSFSAAAKRLYVTQPAVSQAVAQLEKQLKTPLFSRSARGVVLTAEGAVLFEHVRTAVLSIHDGEQRLDRMLRFEEGNLCIGAGDTLSEKLLLPFLGKYHTRYPGVRFQVINRTSSGVLSLLKSGRIDIGFVNMPVADPDIVFRECMPVHDVFVASDMFKHLKGRALSLKEVAEQPLIMLEQLSLSRQYVNEYFSSRGYTITPEIELGAHELLLKFAQIGLGVSCVIREFSTAYFDDRSLFQLELEQPVTPRSIALCYSGVSPLSEASQEFVNMFFSRP